jgi:hypothetical protein
MHFSPTGSKFLNRERLTLLEDLVYLDYRCASLSVDTTNLKMWFSY